MCNNPKHSSTAKMGEHISCRYVNNLGISSYRKQTSILKFLKPQRQIWDILQGVSSLGVKFTKNF